MIFERVTLVEGKRCFLHGRGLSDGERSTVTGLRRQLADWLRAVVTVDDIETLIMPIAVTMAHKSAGGQSAHAVTAWTIALVGLPREALSETVVAILRDEAGLADVHYAPSPPEVRRIAKRSADHAALNLASCEQLLSMTEAPAKVRSPRPESQRTMVGQGESVLPPTRIIDTAYTQRVAADLARRKREREEAETAAALANSESMQ